MNPETPTPHIEHEAQAQEAPQHLLQQRSEDLRKTLDLQEVPPGEWRAIVDNILRTPSDPDASPLRRLDARERLKTHFKLVEHTRIDASDGLRMMLVRSDEVSRKATLRALARYLQERHAYEQSWAGKNTPSPVILPRGLETYLELTAQENLALGISRRVLPLQYDVYDRSNLVASPRILAPLSQELARLAARERVRVGDFLPCIDRAAKAPVPDEAPFRTFLARCGVKEEPTREQIDAAKLLVGYLAKHLDAIEAAAKGKAGQAFNQLTITEALEYSSLDSVLGEFAGEFAMQLARNGKINFVEFRAFVQRTLSSPELIPDRIVEKAFAPFVDIGKEPDDEQKFRDNVKSVSLYCQSAEAKDVSILRVDTLNLNDMNQQKRQMLVGIRNTVMNDEKTLREVLRVCFIKEYPPKSGQDKEVHDEMKRLFQEGRVSLHDAYQIHCLIAAGGAARLMLAHKVPDILATHNQHKLAIRLQYRIAAKYANLLTTDAAKLPTVIGDLNLSPEQEREMSNIVRSWKEQGLDKAGHWVYEFYVMLKEFPWLIPIVLYTMGSMTLPPIIMGIDVYRVLLRIRWGPVMDFSRMTATETMDFATKNGVPVAQVEKAKERVRELREKYLEISGRFTILPRGGALLRQAKEFRRAATAQDMNAMATALKKQHRHAEDTALELEDIDPDPQKIRVAMEHAKYTPDEVRRSLDVLKEKQRLDAEGSQDSVHAALQGIRQRAAQAPGLRSAADAVLGAKKAGIDADPSSAADTKTNPKSGKK